MPAHAARSETRWPDGRRREFTPWCGGCGAWCGGCREAEKVCEAETRTRDEWRQVHSERRRQGDLQCIDGDEPIGDGERGTDHVPNLCPSAHAARTLSGAPIAALAMGWVGSASSLSEARTMQDKREATDAQHHVRFAADAELPMDST